MDDELVWKIKMSDNPTRRAIMNTYCVRAESLVEAVEKAIDLEAKFVEELSESEGEPFEPAEPLSVELLCAIDA